MIRRIALFVETANGYGTLFGNGIRSGAVQKSSKRFSSFLKGIAMFFIVAVTDGLPLREG